MTPRYALVTFDCYGTLVDWERGIGDAFSSAARRYAAGRNWLHAAQSWFHDVVPAEALGIDVAWINRKREPQPAPRGGLQFDSLTPLAESLCRGTEAVDSPGPEPCGAGPPGSSS